MTPSVFEPFLIRKINLHMKNIRIFILFAFVFLNKTTAQTLPETGISGLYEVIMGVKDANYAIKYFNEFGFRVIDSVEMSEADALKLYGVKSKLKSYRMQNGEVDAHGLLRLLVWDKRLGDGVGYPVPETLGSRMAVMLTSDIFRLYDIFKAARDIGKEPWLPTEPIADDLFGLDGKEKNTFFKRPVYVRENAVYGEFFTHVFFQRYGYDIPGYGVINPNSNLKTSEFTHHDFTIKAENMDCLRYLSEGLGMKPEKEPEIDGDWLKGPKRVFVMPDGATHLYQGFVSPNDICGKLKFFIPQQYKPDRTEHQRIGELGITLHSFYTPKLKMVYDNLVKLNIKPTAIQKNEFNENSFVFKGPDGVSWQIIEKLTPTKYTPVKKLEMKMTKN
jgi:hypothetical protein